MFARVGKLFRTTDHQREVGNIDDSFQSGHLIGVDGLYGKVTNKEQFRFRVVHDVLNLLTIKLV